ncbi:MAG: ABC transporter ATP-binding protein [Acidimicrobiales bacterium]
MEGTNRIERSRPAPDDSLEERAGRNGLIVSGARKRFGSITALEDIRLAVPRGEVIGFLGPNGAGKSTTMRAIVGVIALDAGTITWDGVPDARPPLGYMPQERGLYAKMRVTEQIAYFGQLAGLSRSEAARRADDWVERVGLADRADDNVEALSGGNQQRVQLAVALVHDPDLLVFDEPFAGLDPVAALRMREIILDRAEQGAAVLFSSHQLDIVEGLCRDAYIVKHGRVVASGAVDELRSAADHRRVRVRWAEPIPAWMPDVVDPTVVDESGFAGTVPATTDLGGLITTITAHAPVASLSLDPPPLSEIFADLTESGPGPSTDAGHPATVR